MSHDVKFTSFGVPYVLEFENVSFVPEQSPSRSSSSSSFCYIESPPPLPRFPLSSLFKRNNSQPTPAHHHTTKPLPPPPKPDVAEQHGIYIQCPPRHSHSQMTRKQRLIHLQKTISIAVLDAGMSRSSGSNARPENHPSDDRSQGHGSPDAFFCGTYGQLMAALEGAGLSVTPCEDKGFSGHTRLGALFVARNDGTTGVQLRKITLWG